MKKCLFPALITCGGSAARGRKRPIVRPYRVISIPPQMSDKIMLCSTSTGFFDIYRNNISPKIRWKNEIP